jgi:peptide deformylase
MPLSVFINPKITVLDKTEQGFWEGCLSVPELRGLVYRPRKIRVDYLDRDGKKKSVVAEGFLATVFQHELDHLDGVLFVDRIRYEPGKSPISFLEEYGKYHVPDPEGDVGELGE